MDAEDREAFGRVLGMLRNHSHVHAVTMREAAALPAERHGSGR
jgi:hypothetical protein